MKSIQLAAQVVLGCLLSTPFTSYAHEPHAHTTHAAKMTDAQSIEHAMKALFDKPEAPLVVAQ